MNLNYLYWVWFIFAAVFLYLAYMQWRLSQEPLRSFFMREHSTETTMSEDGEQIESLTKEAVDDFNKYLDMLNNRNKRHYTAAAIGYFVAAFISLASMFIMLST